MDDSHTQRSRSFGAVADDYRRARPGYPAAAVEWALRSAPGREVLDLAAGTGKLTEAIVAAGGTVTAVEPLEGMRRELGVAVPGVTILDGTAEQIPLADEAVDAVLVGQAFHWFDQDAALDEIARVLRPRGIVALIWNLRDESEPWARRLSEILTSVDVVSAGIDPESAVLAAHPRFIDVEHDRWPNPVPFDRERLVTWARSTSLLATMEPSAADRLLAEVAELAETHADLAGRATFPLPYVTLAVRARLRG